MLPISIFHYSGTPALPDLRHGALTAEVYSADLVPAKCPEPDRSPPRVGRGYADRPQIESELARRRGTVSPDEGKSTSSAAAHFVEQYAAAKGAQAGQQLDAGATNAAATVDFFGREISVPNPAQEGDPTTDGELARSAEFPRRPSSLAPRRSLRTYVGHWADRVGVSVLR